MNMQIMSIFKCGKLNKEIAQLYTAYIMLKYYDTHFDDYLSTSKENNFHPKIDEIVENLPDDIENMHNIIVYGKSGVGKYTQSLKIIEKYSPTKLKYEKRMRVEVAKSEYIVKMSDIHFEVDMSLLGCNAKLLWCDIYNQIVNIISSRSLKKGIILCKNMQSINSDLLDVLYSYIQKNILSKNVSIRFLFVSESVCFLPDTILDTCEVVGLSAPPIAKLKKQVKQYNKSYSPAKNVSDMSCQNIKYLYEDHEKISTAQDLIIKNICSTFEGSIKSISFAEVRDMIYELFIYETDIPTCIWELLRYLVSIDKITNDNIGKIMCETYKFFRLYNNNYRPIYHFERYFFVLDRLL
jgi:hypothetical protein